MYRRIFAFLLSVLILFSFAGCGEKENYVFVKTADVKGYKPFGASGDSKLEKTENLELVCENEYLGLYYDKETYVVTVFDKRSGKSYTTAHKEQTPDKNNAYLAALNLIYSNTQGKSGSIDSYTQSVALGQVEVNTDSNSVTFTYNIGDVSDGLEVTPSIIGDKHFQKLLDKADSSQKKILERRYSYIEDYNSWSRRKLANPTAIEQLVKVFKDLGYTDEDLARDNKENGVRDTGDSKLAFVVPLKFTLDGDSVLAQIDLDKVEYPKNNPLVKIEFLQYFGAAAAGDKGYFLIPDGSGAIMPFDTVESGAISYEASVYGTDRALRQKYNAAKQADALMSVYGANYNDGGFLAVIEDGEALADIFAYNSGAADLYSKVYSHVNFLKTESVSLGDQKASDNFNYYNFQEKAYGGNYSVRYIFLDKDVCDYNGMAAAYRNYLTATNQLAVKNKKNDAPFVLETVGGILSDKSFLGFQYQGITALTGYEDNLKMTEELTAAGVKNINLRLTAFSGDGLQNTVPDKIKLIGALGGAKELKKMLKSAEQSNISVYPDFEYLTFSANSGLMTKNKYAIKSMDSKSAEIKVVNSATLQRNTQINDNLYYLTALGKLDGINNSVVKFLNKYSFKNLSIADMASSVSSDFTPDAYYDRQSAANYFSTLVSGLSKDYGLMLNAANAKNAGLASIITDAPLWSSQYDFAEGIPFYSMVYHGFVDYSGEAINLASDSKTELLRSVEYGAALKYTLVYKNRDAIKNSDYTNLYSASFEDNLSGAAENYKAMNELYSKTANETIKKHKKLASSVYYTEYSNGVYTVVNYSNKDYESEYGTVSAQNFIIR